MRTRGSVQCLTGAMYWMAMTYIPIHMPINSTTLRPSHPHLTFLLQTSLSQPHNNTLVLSLHRYVIENTLEHQGGCLPGIRGGEDERRCRDEEIQLPGTHRHTQTHTQTEREGEREREREREREARTNTGTHKYIHANTTFRQLVSRAYLRTNPRPSPRAYSTSHARCLLLFYISCVVFATLQVYHEQWQHLSDGQISFLSLPSAASRRISQTCNEQESPK
jgi:hypothetical protein